MTKVIVVTNQKGGIGKTTTATALATGLKLKGYKSLLFDMDPQCNSTDTFRALVHDQATMYDVLVEGDTPISEAIQHTEVGDIVAGDPQLADAEQRLSFQGREYRLKEAMEELTDDYDFIIIDTPPALGVLLTNALTAAHSCIIPITPERYSFQGLGDLDKTIARVRKYSNPNIEIDGLLLIKTDPRRKLAKAAMSELPEVCKNLGTKMFNTYIREAEDVRKAQERRISLFSWARDCTAAQDYMSFIDEYLEDNMTAEGGRANG